MYNRDSFLWKRFWRVIQTVSCAKSTTTRNEVNNSKENVLRQKFVTAICGNSRHSSGNNALAENSTDGLNAITMHPVDAIIVFRGGGGGAFASWRKAAKCYVCWIIQGKWWGRKRERDEPHFVFVQVIAEYLATCLSESWSRVSSSVTFNFGARHLPLANPLCNNNTLNNLVNCHCYLTWGDSKVGPEWKKSIVKLLLPFCLSRQMVCE